MSSRFSDVPRDSLHKYAETCLSGMAGNRIVSIFCREYTWLWLLDPESGQGLDLSAYAEAGGADGIPCFYYEPEISECLLKHCCDPNPQEVILSLSLRAVEKALETEPQHHVFYTTREDEAGRRYMKALFAKPDSSLPFILCAVQDLSDAFRLEAEKTSLLEESLKKAHEDSRATETFLSLLSRDMRTPLHSIMGLTELAQSEKGNAYAIESYLHKISMSGTYMRDVIDDIIQLRMLARKEVRMSPVKTDLVKLVASVSDEIRPVTEERGLHLVPDTTELRTSLVKTDELCLRRILIKLLRNTVDHILAGGTVRLNVRELMKKNGIVMVEFSVASRGIILDQEHLKEVFRPTDYLMDLASDDLNKVDLNLIILKNYVSLMGGTLMAESVRDIGTKLAVTLSFPSADEQPLPDSTTFRGTEFRRFNGRRVLIADDNPLNLELGIKQLELAGFSVTAATNGEEALEQYRRGNGEFDAILMDIRMPKLDGLAATKLIRNSGIPNARRIPIIALTANAFRSDIQQSFNAGMNEHLVKPLDPVRLYQVLAHYIH